MPELKVTFLMLLIVGTASYNFNVVFPLFVIRSLNGNESSYTLLYSVFSAGALCGAFIVARRASVSVRTVFSGAAGLGVSMSVLAAVPTFASALVVAALVGASSVAFMTATTALAQIRTEPHMIGRVLAIQAVLIAGTTPIGGPILGATADAIGARAPLVIGGIAALGAAAYGAMTERRVNRFVPVIP